MGFLVDCCSFISKTFYELLNNSKVLLCLCFYYDNMMRIFLYLVGGIWYSILVMVEAFVSRVIYIECVIGLLIDWYYSFQCTSNLAILTLAKDLR